MKINDRLISFDIYKGFHLLPLHPSMRDWFLFRYAGKYYLCAFFPFDWSLSPWWFTQVMVPFIRELRVHGFRILAYIDDFLVAPSPFGTTATFEDYAAATVAPLYFRASAHPAVT